MIGLQEFYKNEVALNKETEQYIDSLEKTPVTYYLAGTFEGGKIIYAETGANSMSQRTGVFMVKDGEPKADYLMRYSQTFVSAEDMALSSSFFEDFINTDKVNVVFEKVIAGTWAPDSITIKSQKMSLPAFMSSGNNDDKRYRNNVGNLSARFYYSGSTEKETLVDTIPEGDLYELKHDKEGYSLVLYELEMPNHVRVSYELDGEISNSVVQPITWSDGTRNTGEYDTFGAGCGGGNYSLIANVTKDGLTQIGKSDKGQIIYMFKDMALPVAQTLVSEVSSRDGGTTYIGDFEGGDKPYTAEEFVKDRAVIIVEDGMGRMVVFKNRGYFIQGGCAKPVIYLYPQSPLTLDVRVGADVTISEPHYEMDGWRNVTALPDGRLLYRGMPYDSLFWEGLGHGLYTDRSDEGIVVPYTEVISTMRRQLAEQGFNQKETDDFVEFWSLNIPQKQYVRLTWLDTADMNRLAPLYLSTRPDTLLRNFLEMEGLDEPKVLQPQVFNAPERRGFTVTEWGGLAINGLDQLRYPGE